MGQYLEDFKAGKLDLITTDWNVIPKDDQDAIMALITAGDFVIGGTGEQAPVVPSKPIKSKNRGLANVIKYTAIAGLVFGAVSAVIYFL